MNFCEHAKLCSLVVKQLYGLAKREVCRVDIQDTFQALDQVLEAWKDSAVSGFGVGQQETGLQNPSSPSLCDQSVEKSLRYFELKVTIHHKYTRALPSALLKR